MTKPSQSGFKRFFYNQNIKRDKSGKKYKNLIDHAIILVKRVEKEGMNAWLDNAVNKAKKKIQAYGIALRQFEAALQHKKLDHLTALFHEIFGGEEKTKAVRNTPVPRATVVKKEVVKKEVKKSTTKKTADTKTVKAPKKEVTTVKKAPVKKEVKENNEKKTPAKKTPTTKTTKTKTSK